VPHVTPQIAIRTFVTRSEAEVVRGLLESSGISAWVSADDAGGLYPFQLSDGAHVMIRESDRKAAESVLADATRVRRAEGS
jgi:hypothetical protein